MISLVTHEEELKPTRQTKFSAAYDLHAAEDINLDPFKPIWVPTGVFWTITPPDINVHAIIYMRSKLWLEGLSCHSSPIDADFEQEIKVGLKFIPSNGLTYDPIYNIVQLSPSISMPQEVARNPLNYFITKGERIAQLVIYKHAFIDGEEEVRSLRVGGFGSTRT